MGLTTETMKKAKSLTIVIKLGTSSIVHETTHEPRLSTLSVIVETAVKLRRDGHRVVLVSSGAIGVALQMMDLEKRPKSLPQVQALAALGQARLMSIWDRFFMHMKQPVAQILLTRNDIADRTQYLNAQNTMNELLNMGIIPIVNENDTLSVAEIKFGDNDTLSAITAAMLSADYLFLMTDVDCLYTSNPRHDPDAEPILVVSDISKLEADVSSAGSALGTGGMGTKIVAAKLATAAGVTTVITRSSQPGNVADIVTYVEAVRHSAEVDGLLAPLHTRFLPSLAPIRDRSFWLLHGLAPHGTLYIDEGAHRALRNGAGLLPVGIVGVEGYFAQQEAVRIVVVPSSWSASANGANGATSTGPTTPHRGSSKAGSAPRSPALGNSGSDTDAHHAAASHSRQASRGSTGNPLAGLAGYESLDIDLGAGPPPPSSGSVDGLATPPRQYAASGKGDGRREVGRALVNYAAPEVTRIQGLQSHEIAAMLGYADSEYVALRENVSLFDGKEREIRDVPAKLAERARELDHHDEIRRALPQRIGDLASFA